MRDSYHRAGARPDWVNRLEHKDSVFVPGAFPVGDAGASAGAAEWGVAAEQAVAAVLRGISAVLDSPGPDMAAAVFGARFAPAEESAEVFADRKAYQRS